MAEACVGRGTVCSPEAPSYNPELQGLPRGKTTEECRRVLAKQSVLGG